MDTLGPRVAIFRASLRVVWRLVAFLTLALAPLVILAIARLDPFTWERAALTLASLVLIPVLVFALLTPLLWIYRVGVHPLGLHAFDAYGRFFSVSWPTIASARRVDILVLPYLRILTTEHGVELIIPLALVRQREFERMVIQYAGPQNPLSRHFAK